MTAAPHEIALHGSRVLIGAGLLDECGSELRATLPGRRFVIVTDENVGPLYAARLVSACGSPAPAVLTIPAGEASKSRDEWSSLTDQLLDLHVGRDSAILALGGGVVGDLAGFVAATYLRGIPVVQVPTTLLAMIDASVGGKTGVDTRHGKNLVGAFHQPALVLADPGVLGTLPVAEWRNGFAEAVKHAVIASAPDFIWLGTNAAAIVTAGGPDAAMAGQLVRRNVEIKVAVVSRDERESGVRKILNFGHTIGHAIEMLSDFAMGHGECVAIGMVVESRIAARAGVGDPGLTGMLVDVLRQAGLPTTVPAAMTSDAILRATLNDKKARDGVVEYALPAKLGKMAGAAHGYGIPVPNAIVSAVLDSSR